MDIKKYLDQEGLAYLWKKLSLQDYPNNDTLVAVINAIDENKADKKDVEALAKEMPPNVTESHQQLITDADGNKKWEDRTHYVTHVESTVEVPETTFTTMIDGGQGIAALSNYPKNISIGDTREITYDGVVYTCTAYEFAYTPGSIALGNESLMGTDSNTGEPFFWIILPNASNLVTADTVATEHTISCATIAYDEVHKLSDVYIPTSVPVIQSASANQAVAVESVDENTGEITGWKTVDVALKSDMSGVLKTADNVEANEDGTISSAVSRVFSIVDASAVGASLNNYGRFTAQELYDSLNSGFINTRFSRFIIGNTTATRFCTSWEKKDSVMICYFGDDIAPIIVNPTDNTFTLDPDWVAPVKMPDTTEAHQYLTTNSEGEKVWEEKLAYTTKEEQEFIPEATIEKGWMGILTASIMGSTGDLVTVTYNDVVYQGTLDADDPMLWQVMFDEGVNFPEPGLLVCAPGINASGFPWQVGGTIKATILADKHHTLPSKYLGIAVKPGDDDTSVKIAPDSTGDGEASYYSVSMQSGRATGAYSVALGNGNSESFFSFTQGSGTAKGQYASAFGEGTIATADNSFTTGKYNIEDTEKKYAHIVGNGDRVFIDYNTGHKTTPSNAHTLDWDGNAWFAGNIKVGGTGQDDESAVEVATKNDLTGYVKTINGVEPDENGEVTSDHIKIVDLYDNTAYPGGKVLCYTEDASSLVNMFRDTTVRIPVLTRVMANMELGTYDQIFLKSYDIFRIDGGYAVRLHFSDKYADIIANDVDNTITLDPDWVAPEETATKSDVAAVQTQIDTLNGTGEGSVKHTVAESVATIVANAPEDFDTLKEVADWIANDTLGTADLLQRVSTAENNITTHINNKENPHNVTLEQIGLTALTDADIDAICSVEIYNVSEVSY